MRERLRCVHILSRLLQGHLLALNRGATCG
jgi:hypothetical protein